MTVSENTTLAPAVQGRRRRKKPLNINRERRQRMEAIVESLVTLLDEMDGDLDLEPSLGGGYHANGKPYDAEGEDDNGIADQDGLNEQLKGEPDLGWTGDMNQTRAMRASVLPWSVMDGEEGDDNGIADRGGRNFDDEDGHDREWDPADHGVADQDALPECFPGLHYGAVL